MLEVPRHAPRRLRAAAFLAVCVLLAAEWFTTTRAFVESTDRLDAIYGNAIPSVEELGDVLDGLTRVRRDVRGVLRHPADDADLSRAGEVAGSYLATIREHAAAYRRYPGFPGEATLQERFARALEGLETASQSLVHAPTVEGRQRVAFERFLPATDEAYDAVVGLVRLNAREAARTARSVYAAQETADRSARRLLFTFLAVALGLGLYLDRVLVRVEREGEARLAELDAFAARVAHDLKGPLSPILIGLSVLRRHLGETASEAVLGSLRRSETAVERMTALIDGLLAFARAGSAPSGATASLDDVVASLATTTQPLVESERARLAFEVAPGLAVRADPGVLASIVQNLVRNALGYLGDSPERSVVVRAWPDEAKRAVVIEVRDTGPGIPADVQRRIFRPFERGTTSVPGHGLGLATVKRLAEAHGGAVWLESLVGAGSTFRVRLPRA